jgi:hypothetical protein
MNGFREEVGSSDKPSKIVTDATIGSFNCVSMGFPP